jgi:tetratricopeptide (TPR) repeat protein
VYWFKGDNLRSLAALDRQLQIATEINDQRGLCEALDTMGMVYWSQGDWDRSVECCLKSIAIAEPLGYKLVITRAAITLGNVGHSRHDLLFAVQWYRTAYEVARAIDDRQVISWALVNVANIISELGDFQRALAYNLAGLDIDLGLNDSWTTFQTLANFGETLKRLGASWQAGELYQWAADLGRKLDSPSYLSGVLSDFAELRLEQQCIDEAAALYAEAQTLAARVTGERMAGGDTRLTLAILNVQLQHRRGSLIAQGAVRALEQLLTEYHFPEQQATIHYAAWQIDPAAESHRTQAAELYRTLGLKAPLYVYRQRYHELSGETLPEPPSLPDLPGVEILDHIDLVG